MPRLQATMTVLTFFVCHMPLADRTTLLVRFSAKLNLQVLGLKAGKAIKVQCKPIISHGLFLSVSYLRFNIIFTCTERHSWGKITHSSCDPSYPFWDLYMCILQGAELYPESTLMQVPWGTQSDLPLHFICFLPEPC